MTNHKSGGEERERGGRFVYRLPIRRYRLAVSAGKRPHQVELLVGVAEDGVRGVVGDEFVHAVELSLSDLVLSVLVGHLND